MSAKAISKEGGATRGEMEALADVDDGASDTPGGVSKQEAAACDGHEPGGLPTVSIIVPCRNERGFIDKTLDSIVASDFPKEKLEVLIVDGMSGDGTREVVAEYARRHAFMRVLDNPGGTTPVAFNIGVRASRGELVMIMSAHATYEVDAIRKCVLYSLRYGADNVGGRWKVHPRRGSVVDVGIARALGHPFGVGGALYRTLEAGEPRWVDTAAYGCYRREVFDRIGLFNEELTRGQDMEFNMRLRRANGRTLLAPDVVIHYFARSDVKSFMIHNFRNGLWAVLPFAYSDVIPVRWRHMVPLLFVAALAGSAAFGAVWSWWWFVGAAGPYVVANVAASAHVAWQERDVRCLGVMPVVFGGLHVAYGLGSAWGVMRLVAEPRMWQRVRSKLVVDTGMAKRAFDLVGALAGFLVLSPVLMVLGLLVKLEDGGPVFYRGVRVGRYGKPFRIFKFRTMVVNAERLGGPSTADDDPRITRIGRRLRRHKLDELPQLLNVLTGDMSFVGPRPEVEQYVRLFTEEERAILSVRPGITDWASLWNPDEGAILAGSPDPERTYLEKIRPEKIRLQLEYVRRRSVWTDMMILVQTLATLVLRRRPRIAEAVGRKGG